MTATDAAHRLPGCWLLSRSRPARRSSTSFCQEEVLVVALPRVVEERDRREPIPEGGLVFALLLAVQHQAGVVFTARFKDTPHGTDGAHRELPIRQLVIHAKEVGGELRDVGRLDVGVVPNTDQILLDGVEAVIEGSIRWSTHLGVLLTDVATLLRDLHIEQFCLRDGDGFAIQLWHQRHLVEAQPGLALVAVVLVGEEARQFTRPKLLRFADGLTVDLFGHPQIGQCADQFFP